jgi:hypothetical protein
MTKPESPDHDDAPSGGLVLAKRALLSMLAGLALIFLAGVFAGYLSVAIEHSFPSLIDVVILGCTVGLMAVVVYGAWRFWPSISGEPVAQSTRKATRILYAMCGLGAIMGVALVVADDGSSAALFSNGPIGNLAATLTIFVWAVVVPALTWVWWQTVDEHEAGTYAESGLLAAHAYLIGAPTWWLATRAGWLPPQDPMIMWLAVATLWSIIWFYRKYF